MPQTLEALSRRNDTLTSIRGIVHTMKTLSAINAVPYEQAVNSIEAYHKTILDGFKAFLHRTGPVLLRPQAQTGHVVVAFGSDHGLCGGYNQVLAAKIVEDISAVSRDHSGVHVLCVGARMNNALMDQGVQSDRVLLPPASADGIGRLATDLIAQLEETGTGDSLGRMAITLAFTRMGKHGRQEPSVLSLMPLDKVLTPCSTRPVWESRSLPTYTLASDALFAALIRNHIFASLFRASAEAMVTENAARLKQMQRAEESVDDRLAEVKADMRSVRQTEITTELLDVIIGFEALKKPRRLES